MDISLALVYDPTLSIIGEGAHVCVSYVTAPLLNFLRIVRQLDLSNQILCTVIDLDAPGII